MTKAPLIDDPQQREMEWAMDPEAALALGSPDAAREPSAHRRGGGAVFTAPFNLTGYPALSMPCGVSSTGLPMGVQLAGRRLEEARLLQIAARFQEHIGWNRHAAMDFVRRRQDQSVCQETSHC